MSAISDWNLAFTAPTKTALLPIAPEDSMTEDRIASSRSRTRSKHEDEKDVDNEDHNDCDDGEYGHDEVEDHNDNDEDEDNNDHGEDEHDNVFREDEDRNDHDNDEEPNDHGEDEDNRDERKDDSVEDKEYEVEFLKPLVQVETKEVCAQSEECVDSKVQIASYNAELSQDQANLHVAERNSRMWAANEQGND